MSRLQQTKGRKRTFTDDSYSSDGYHRDRCSTLFKILAFVGFFVGLAALALVVMITLGMLSLPSCHDCKKEIVPVYFFICSDFLPESLVIGKFYGTKLPFSKILAR